MRLSGDRDFKGEGGMRKKSADVTTASAGQRSQRAHYCRGVKDRARSNMRELVGHAL